MYQLVCTINCVEEKPQFLRPLEDITLNEVGLTATFECEVSLEGLKAEWQKANKPVKANGRISIVADKKIHRLIISDAKGEDEGQYTVLFKEKDLKSSAKLAVKGFEILFAANCWLITNCNLFNLTLSITMVNVLTSFCHISWIQISVVFMSLIYIKERKIFFVKEKSKTYQVRPHLFQMRKIELVHEEAHLLLLVYDVSNV